MGRHTSVREGRILHIGRTDASLDSVWQGLQQDGFIVDFASTQRAGLQKARELEPDIVVINTYNSHFSGQRLSELLGRRMPRCQRILIVHQGEGRQIACEERLTRPFTPRKLKDAIRRLIANVLPHVLKVGPVELDVTARTVVTMVGLRHLTPKQCRLLSVFMQHPNQVISRQELMKEIWETQFMEDTRTLDVHIRWLREKIEVDPKRPTLLVTKRGVGYRLTIPLANERFDAVVETEDQLELA